MMALALLGRIHLLPMTAIAPIKLSAIRRRRGVSTSRHARERGRCRYCPYFLPVDPLLARAGCIDRVQFANTSVCFGEHTDADQADSHRSFIPPRRTDKLSELSFVVRVDQGSWIRQAFERFGDRYFVSQQLAASADQF